VEENRVCVLEADTGTNVDVVRARRVCVCGEKACGERVLSGKAARDRSGQGQQMR
jgi:hypothetical protein